MQEEKVLLFEIHGMTENAGTDSTTFIAVMLGIWEYLIIYFFIFVNENDVMVWAEHVCVSVCVKEWINMVSVKKVKHLWNSLNFLESRKWTYQGNVAILLEIWFIVEVYPFCLIVWLSHSNAGNYVQDHWDSAK